MFNWSNEQWTQHYEWWTYEYDEENRLTLEIRWTEDYGLPAIQYIVRGYAYHADGLIKQRYNKFYDFYEDKLLWTWRETYAYRYDGQPAHTLVELGDPYGGIDDEWLTTWEYNEDGDVTLMLKENIYYGVNENNQRVTYSWDENRNNVSEVTQDWSGASWINKRRSLYYYDFTSSVLKASPNELSFTIYPNPTSERVFIQLIGPVENTWETIIYSSSGERLFTTQLRNGSNIRSIDVSHLATGTYFLKVNSRNGTGVETIGYSRQLAPATYARASVGIGRRVEQLAVWPPCLPYRLRQQRLHPPVAGLS